MILTFLASFTVFIFARCFSIWLTFVMHLWSRFSSVVWKIYRYFNVLHSLFLCLRYWRCAEMSPRRIASVELALRRIVPSPSCPIPMYRQHCTRLKWINIAVLIKRANTMAYAPKGHPSIWSIGNMADLRWLVVGYMIRDAGWCRIGEIIVRGWRREAGT